MTISLTIQPDPSIALDLSVDGNIVEVTTREEGEYGVVVTLPLPVLRASLDGLAAYPDAETESPDLMDGGVTSALIEKEAEECSAEQPRALTPDDITDEMRDRAYRAVAALSVSDWDDMSGVAKGRAMALVEAVITEITRPEPPTRPEGAEAVSSVLGALRDGDGEWMTYASDEDLDGLADAMAERGVRVASVGLTPTNPETED